MDLKKIFESLYGRTRQEWTDGSGDNESGWNEERPKIPNIRMPKISRIWFILGGIFILFTVILPGLAVFLTDLYWFESYGFESVFWRRFTARWELFFIALVPAFAIYWFNWNSAWKSGLRILNDASSGENVKFNASKWVIIVAAALMALVNALNAMGSWGTFLKFMNPTPFGESDPLFGLDVGFYVFTLPFIKYIQSWFQGVLVITLLGTFVSYFMTRSLSLDGTKLTTSSRARLHMSLLGVLFLLIWGAGYWLARYELLFSPTGVVFGAGYTDVNILLPAFNILTVAAVVAAALLLMNFYKPMWKMSAVLIGALLLLGWVSSSFVPGLVQQYRVKPNEYEMEKPFLDYHLDYTRRAFGLNNVRTIDVTPENEVTPEELLADQETVKNIRLWDYSPLLRTYKQLQAIRTYYDFEDVYIDRYKLNGGNRQVMLSVRELDLSKLQNQTWVNMHLEFTHGYGVVMNPVNEVSPGGLPFFFMKDLPPRSTVDIRLDSPQIYYGSMKDFYVLVNTDVKEFDYPMGDSNVRSTYEGAGGVEIGSFWKRLLFTLRFRDTEILFTGALRPESRILYYRNVREALKEIAPFLIFDQDTYPVIFDGRIIWVQDAFTWTHRYPYSKPVMTPDPTLSHFNGVNYIRNSVKATVDAYDGKMSFYVVDEKDPLVQTWRKIFPAIFKPAGEMSEVLWKHMRYPEDFFEVQTDVYRTYHMTDTNTYYNREDVWEVTPVGRKRRISPNYVTMKLWGEKDPEFAIIVPYMPLGRDNLIGWMAGRCDPGKYGELLVYQFPKQKLIYGPAQIEALINQNPEISAQLSLWSQRGSEVIIGDLLVIPIGKSLLYVQPLYLKAENGELPELKRVIVSTGGRVEWDETFAGALEKLIGKKASEKGSAVRPGSVADMVGGSGSGVLSGDNVLGEKDISALAKQAQEIYDSAQEAQRQGNWALYGDKIKELGNVISELEKRSKE
ncbi:MAG: UPF0182 family protein [Synergistaceae bacterium]|nr:UPF0182 family protein [Synergistaceae bacterium]